MAAKSRKQSSGRMLNRDARRDRLDFRDLTYRAPLKSLPACYPAEVDIAKYLPAYTKSGLILNQGDEGACTGFGLSAVVNYLSWSNAISGRGKLERASPYMLYSLARLYDEWPGEDYEGSSCRGALKGWQKHGVCAMHLWTSNAPDYRPQNGWDVDAMERTLGVYYRLDAASIVDMQAAINEIGAIYASGDTHAGWNLKETVATASFANLPDIRKPKQKAVDGGHAFALVGYDRRGFVVQNSWGTDWGLGGFARLTYEDWLEYGYDAWACALGVPRAGSAATAHSSPRARLGSATPVGLGHPIQHMRRNANPAGARLTQDQAYLRALVLGNEGIVERRLVEEQSSEAAVEQAVSVRPAKWFSARPAAEGPERHLLIYAHGGLNSEAAAIERIRVLAPVFEENGIYPLFITWRTGVTEVLGDMLKDAIGIAPGPAQGVLDRALEAVDEAKDILLEAFARAVAVKAIWSEMKENAAAASGGRGGLRLAVDELKKLQQSQAGNLRIHLAGHSAGAILLAHFLERFRGEIKIDSCTLFAPACTVELANQSFAKTIEAGDLKAKRFAIHTLSDELECADSVGPYGKSLLYLVSRALEPVRKMPILGLNRCFDGTYNKNRDQWNDAAGYSAVAFQQLAAWQKFCAANLISPVTEIDKTVSQGTLAADIRASHGCFDNHVGVIGGLIRRITGRKPAPILDLEF